MVEEDELDSIREIQQEIKNIAEEINEKEREVYENLESTEAKKEKLNNMNSSSLSMEEAVNLFVETCHDITKDFRAEKEIENLINELKEKERTYETLINKIGSIKDEDKKKMLGNLLRRIDNEELKEAIKKDRSINRKEEKDTQKQIEDLSEPYNVLRGRLGRSESVKKLDDAWTEVTSLEFHT